MKKLSVSKILLGSFLLLWHYSKCLINAIKLPVIGLLLFTLFWTYAGIEFPQFVHWLFVLVYLFLWCSIFFIVHRVILLGVDYVSSISQILLNSLKYFLWFVLFYFIYAGFEILMYRGFKTIIYNLFIPAMQSFFGYKIKQIHLVSSLRLVSEICALYITMRFSLIFPALAVNKKINLFNSVNYTLGNGWRLMFVVLPIPLLFLFLFDQLYMVTPPIQEGLLYFLFGLPFFLVGICGLSLAYKELTAP